MSTEDRLSEGFVHHLLRDIGRAEARAVNEEDRQYTSFYYERLELRMCYICGAVVKNERTHTAWHAREES